jgi:hypothetical protein
VPWRKNEYEELKKKKGVTVKQSSENVKAGALCFQLLCPPQQKHSREKENP